MKRVAVLANRVERFTDIGMILSVASGISVAPCTYNFFTASAGAFLEQGVSLGIPISLGLAARYHFVKRNACEDELAALEDQDHKKD